MQINPIENVKSTETKLVFRSLVNARRTLHIEEIYLKKKKKTNSAVAYVFSDTQGRQIQYLTNPAFDKTKELIRKFRFTWTAPYRALTLSQTDCTLN